MEALRDTVILLQNDNAELVVEHNHVRDLGAQQLRAQQQQMKEQEILFLNHLKSRDLEIERLRVGKSEALQWHEQDQARIIELEGMLDSLKGSMNDVECDLGSTRVSTAELELQHKKAVRELEQEIALLRSRNTDSQARSPVSSRTGNKSALIELQSAMESATERSMYFASSATC